MTHTRHLLSFWRHLCHQFSHLTCYLAMGTSFECPPLGLPITNSLGTTRREQNSLLSLQQLSSRGSSRNCPIMSLLKFCCSFQAWSTVRQQVCYSLKEHSEKQHIHTLELCFHELEIQRGMHLYKSIFVYIKDTFTQYRFLFKNMLKTYS